MTHHYAILTEPWTQPRDVKSLPWHAWTNAQEGSREEGRRLAIHKFLRESGYLNPGAMVKHLTLHLYDWLSTDPCRKDGTPMVIDYTTYHITPRN